MSNTTYWNEQAERLVGRIIISARYMTKEERWAQGWRSSPLVLELDDGTLLFPSSDDEGNNGGALFGHSANGESFGFPVL